MQIVFQDPFGALNPRMSVEETIMEPLLIHGSAPERCRRHASAVARMLDMVGLPDSARYRFPHGSSPAASEQRIGIARALILRPKSTGGVR